MFDSKSIGDKPVLVPKFARAAPSESVGSAGAEVATPNAQRQEHEQNLVSSRQLRSAWSGILDNQAPAAPPPPPPEPEAEKPPQNLNEKAASPHAKVSGGENANVSRLDVQVFAGRLPEKKAQFEELDSETRSTRDTEAQAKTFNAPEAKTTSAGSPLQGTVKNVSTSAAANKEAESAPAGEEGTAAHPRPASGPEEGPKAAENRPQTAQKRAEADNKSDLKKQEANREQANKSAVTVQTTYGNPVKTAQVFQAVMNQGMAPPPPKKTEESPSRKTPKELASSDGEAKANTGAGGAGRGAAASKGGQTQQGRGNQAALSGSVGKLSAGWSGEAPSGEAKLANGRVATAHIPVHSPILDQVHEKDIQRLEAHRLARTEENLKLGLKGQQQLQGRQLAEFALRHAGQTMETLLKKAYRLDSRKELSRQEAVNFMTLVLKLGGEFTFGHSTRVLDLALDLADEVGVDSQTREDVQLGAMLKDMGEMGLMLSEAPPDKLEKIGEWLSGQDLLQAGLLHDIGKTQIPPEILYKPGKLTEEEYELMKLHPILGEQMIFPIQSMRHLCPVIRSHHERWDGKGYPDGISGEAIPLGARIIALADVFDALAAERPYKAGMPIERVRAILGEGKGTHFDPQLAEAFERVIQRRHPELRNPFE
jgi:HD-GYP domain-containing protein (c-di-GMP phosphodiesterase class II)